MLKIISWAHDIQHNISGASMALKKLNNLSVGKAVATKFCAQAIRM